jgi:hypothetical protein
MRGRTKSKPPIQLTIWKPDGKLWYAEKADLERVVKESNVSDEELKRRMLRGYDALLDALNGKRIDGWSVAFIEGALLPRKN